MENNVASALCYLLGLITGIIFLILAPYSKNPVVRFHAFQSIFLNVACIVVSVALNIVFLTLHLWMLTPLITLAFIGVWLYMLIMVYQGKSIVLPVIGPIAQQQARN